MQHQAGEHQGGQHHQPQGFGGAGREHGRLAGPDLAKDPDQSGADQRIGQQHQPTQQPGMVTGGRERHQLAQGGEATEGWQPHQAGRPGQERHPHQGAAAPEAAQLGEVLGDVGEHDGADRHQHQCHRQRIDQHQVVGNADPAQAHGDEQQPQPAADQEGKGPLDIDLGQGDQGPDHGRGTPHHHQYPLHQGAQRDQRLQAQQQPGTAHHHHRIA